MRLRGPKNKIGSFVFRYAAATALVIVATVLTSGLWLIVNRPVSAPLFIVAIVLSTWLFGLRVGIYASLIAGVAIDYYFIGPFYEFTASREEIVRLALFVGEGTFLSLLINKLRIFSDEIRVSREELRELTKHQQTLRETEQKRIALEIHDELGQALTGLKMDVHFIRRQLLESGQPAEGDEIVNDLDKLSKKIDVTIGTVRRISSEIRPSILDDFGLVAASEWQAREFQRNSDIRCHFSSVPEEMDLGNDANTAVFRILQEALTNVARHAHARSVIVRLQNSESGLTMTVADDGVGIGGEGLDRRKSLGILGMRERSRLIGGILDISSSQEGGTRVELRLPRAADRHLNTG
ncbi:MAG: sensor histidine kinase [Acidobacteriota bacterium]